MVGNSTNSTEQNTEGEEAAEEEEETVETCVDFASWGFSRVRQAKFTPSTRYLNQMRCFYFMQPDGVFNYPARVAASHDAMEPLV